ncbi:hypothetical protein [Natribacillus halophilus]|uniref:Uncharacterized protein n=1 Tax=Natribacillus halophilus TaxID=549003 RepID=A0A1G8NNU8_9BACI|nr:hypothetical protein [Natribacillus halophilus]SDI81180.1 hypothetical protein SAMN04488123_106143 [Natribacillus halophilus]
MQAVWFGVAIFVGWLIIDWSKEKRIHREQVLYSLVAGIIGGLGWAVIDWVM